MAGGQFAAIGRYTKRNQLFLHFVFGTLGRINLILLTIMALFSLFFIFALQLIHISHSFSVNLKKHRKMHLKIKHTKNGEENLAIDLSELQQLWEWWE